MRIIDNRKHCHCAHGCDIYSGDKKYIGDGKNYCIEHGRIKSLHDGFRIWLGRQLRDNMKQANKVQKKLMEDIAIWAANGGLRLLYGDAWEFSPMQLHHVKGRSFKHNKVAIGHEFILPVPFDLHDVSSNHKLNVTHHKHAFTDEFGKQSEMYEVMYLDMECQGYTVPSLNILHSILGVNA